MTAPTPGRRVFLFVCLLLAALETAAIFQIHQLASIDRGEKRRGATYPLDAVRWRRMTLVDREGRIPPNALIRAKQHVDRMRARAAAQERAAAAEGTLTSTAAVTRQSWRWLGPGNVGGRLRALAIHPTTPSTMFAGSVSGGIWKTTDSGATWLPVNDFMGNLAVSALAFDPRDPNVMYAGTGETAFFNGDAIRGAGIFKSVDGGTTWTQLSATASSPDYWTVARFAFSRDGQILLAGTGAGVRRSTDGGATFSAVGVQFNALCVAFDPADNTRAMASGAGGFVFYSRDGGLTWRRSAGFPSAAGRIEVAYARSQPNIVYAVSEYRNGAIYRSSDGGATFTEIHPGELIQGQGWYNLAIWVNPRDANHVLVGGIILAESTDGGVSWNSMFDSGIHVDQHVIVHHPGFDNSSNRRIFIGNDGGVFRHDLAPGYPKTYYRLNNNLGVTQFYGAAGNAQTGVIIGGTQDNGNVRRVPRSGTYWTTVAGGDGGFVAADPQDPNYFYFEYIYLQISRTSDGGTSYAGISSGISDAGRFANFIAPFILDPNNPLRMYAGANRLWRTENVKAGTPAWSVVKAAEPSGDNYISAIAVAPGNPDIVWVGHNYGNVYKTTNGTSATPTWTAIAGAGSGYVTRITIDPLDWNTVYVSRGGFSANNISRTMDGGITWSDATGVGDTGLPNAPVRDVDVDPDIPSTIYAGTEVGVFVSTDRGHTWQVPHDGPANVSVDELFLMDRTLVAATHGRGLFAADLGDAGTPALSLSPPKLEFPPTTVWTEAPRQPLTVTNSGTAALTVESFAVQGPNYDEFNPIWSPCDGVNLAPSQSCTVDVQFFPFEQGPRTATIWVSTTAPGSPHTVPVSGTGVSSGGGVPAPWTSQDIGSVGLAGRASENNGTFTVEGAGADIWGTADAFHFVHQTMTGDGAIVARVTSVENVAAWVKAGVMIRAAPTPGSAHALMLVSAGKGLAFQRRTVTDGTTTHTSGGPGTAPVWLRVSRTGNVITAAWSSNGTAWTAVGQQTMTLPSTVHVGLAVSSHTTSQLATATFDNVAVTIPPAPGLPAGWATADVGAVGIAGSASESAGTFTLEGAGADVWGTADAFRFAYKQLDGDGTIVARVAAVENVAAWTKVGVMFRQTLDPGSAHAFALVSAGKGVAFQRRRTGGGTSTHTAGSLAAAPRWVRLVRQGQLVTASESSNGSAWTTIAQDTVAFSGPVLAGLVVSSHDTTSLATGTFDNVQITPASTLPPGWSDTDVGAVGPAGAGSFSGQVFTVKGAGADIWGTADAFHYTYTTLAGDGDVVARVATVENVAAWTKAGVMIRETLNPGSAHALMLVSAGKGLAFQRRVVAGGVSTHTSGGAGTAPKWVRLQRRGNTIAAAWSPDGMTWIPVGEDTIAMAGTVRVGLAVSSHDATRLAAAAFDGVSVQPVP